MTAAPHLAIGALVGAVAGNMGPFPSLTLLYGKFHLSFNAYALNP